MNDDFKVIIREDIEREEYIVEYDDLPIEIYSNKSFVECIKFLYARFSVIKREWQGFRGEYICENEK